MNHKWAMLFVLTVSGWSKDLFYAFSLFIASHNMAQNAQRKSDTIDQFLFASWYLFRVAHILSWVNQWSHTQTEQREAMKRRMCETELVCSRDYQDEMHKLIQLDFRTTRRWVVVALNVFYMNMLLYFFVLLLRPSEIDEAEVWLSTHNMHACVCSVIFVTQHNLAASLHGWEYPSKWVHHGTTNVFTTNVLPIVQVISLLLLWSALL